MCARCWRRSLSSINAQQFREALTDAIGSAWGVARIHYGRPKIERDAGPALPYAVVRLDAVPMEFGTLTCVEQVYRFDILGRFPWPTVGEIEEIKEGLANDLIEKLMATSAVHDGYLPMVDDVRFSESEPDEEEPKFEITVTWSIRRQISALT